MTSTEKLINIRQPVDKEPVVNDFSITVATVNGSGSQTSNLTLLRAMFKMGIPVSGKNNFPSNIQGLPTWYTIRVSKDGYLARRDEHEIVVAMNPQTFQSDLHNVAPGGVFIYADDLKMTIDRDDVSIYPIPAKSLVKQSDAPSQIRDYVVNMVYVGVMAQLFDIDMEKIKEALEFHFKGRAKPIKLNLQVIESAAIWAKEDIEKNDPFSLEAMDKTENFILTDGNTSAALGSIYGGVHFASWYPITPASSLAESLIQYLPVLRKDPKTGKNTFAVAQAEDELAAIGMTIGAGWSGLRAMTSTSGPGLSLMTEFAGLAYFAEIPIVIWDVQRVGPSTGLPTRTSQGDLTMVNFLGHGDTQQVILLPGSVYECFEFGWKAFDLAERLQTPVFVLSDLDLGMNQWISKPFEYPDKPMDRGKVLWEDDLDKLEHKWGRYMDIDGDGIPYRTVPGNRHPKSAYFTRGTGHDEFANYSEDPVVWEETMSRLKNKFDTARTIVPEPVIEMDADNAVGLIAFGSVDASIIEARDILVDRGLNTDYMRIRAIPFTKEVRKFVEKHDRLYVLEINRDGQMHQILTIELPELANRLISLPHFDGMPLTARWIVDAVLAQEEK